jgi:hypothetical protein
MALIPDWPDPFHRRSPLSSGLQASNDGLLGKTMHKTLELSESTGGGNSAGARQERRKNKNDTPPKRLNGCIYFFGYHI